MSDDQKQRQQEHSQGLKPGIKHGSASGISDIHGAVTTKYNQVFMLTDERGDILPDSHGFGLYFRDMRYLDHLELRLGNQHTISLLADAGKGSECVFELTNPQMKLSGGRTIPKERLSIRRSYTLHHAVTHCIAVRNLDREEVAFDLTLIFASDFDDMLVIRGFLPGPEKRGTVHPPQMKGKTTLLLAYDGADKHQRTTAIEFSPAPDETGDDGTITYHVRLEPGQTKTLKLDMKLGDAGPDSDHRHSGSQTTRSGAEKHSAFDKALAVHPQIETSNPLFDRALQRSLDDVRLLATANGNDVLVAAGIPWYVALFGRDSCITAFETLAFQPELARSTLDVLARYQGTTHNAYQDEEPGKILHELRVGEAANLHEVPMTPYYGTVDATPWFLMLTAEYVRWTGDLDFFHQMRDNVNRGLAWMDENEDEHLRGFLTYGTKSEKGLINQGWKDSDNGVVNEDGSLVEPPVALVEVQGYAYRARRDIAEMLRVIGDTDSAQALEQKAEALKQRFNERFWMDDENFYGFALQRGDRLSRAIASNPGQTLFTGIVTEERARAVADRLMRDDIFCGWGIRTLSAHEVAYNPLDYQVGSIWPHDNALIALGMRHWGATDYLDRIFTGIYQAATHFTDFRLPEVFDGFSQSQYTRPVKYPVACSPQAWAAGALPLLLQTALGLEPRATKKMLFIHRPYLPAWLSDVTVHSLRVGDAMIDLRYSREADTTLVAVLKREGDIVVQVEY